MYAPWNLAGGECPTAPPSLCAYAHGVPAGTKGWWVMAAKQRRKSHVVRQGTRPVPRRTRAARYTPRTQRDRVAKKMAPRPKLRFLKKDRVFHLVDPTAFVLTIDRKGIEHRGPAKDARTICCDKPIAKVFGIAISRASFREPVAWCAGVPA